MLTNNNNVKKKVYIFAGNEHPRLQGTYHNIGWEIANNWEANLEWKKQGNSLIATAKNGDILIKPVAKNPMDYDKNHKFAKSIHKDDYYGRGDNYTNGYDSGDYNSAGISIQELVQNATIKSEYEFFIVSDNQELKQGDINLLTDARYFRDKENNAIKDILMRNPNIKFSRIDIGVPKNKHHNKIETENIDIEKIVASVKKANIDNFLIPNITRQTSFVSSNLNQAIQRINNSPNKEKDIFIMLDYLDNLKNGKTNEADIICIESQTLMFLYFVADNYPDVAKKILKYKEIKHAPLYGKYHESYKNIIENIDDYCKKIGNKKTYNTYLPISKYIEERNSKNPAKKILTPFMDQVFSSPANGIRQYNAELNDFLSFGVDIFDKKHYQDKDSFNLLSNKIDELIDKCDSCFFMPNDFNIRDEFKPVNGFKQKINLATETNDAVRTFWEQYTLNKAAEKQKGVSGICGGHQMIANAMGFFVCRLSQKHLHKNLKEKDKASSPTRGGELVDVYSQHTQGVPLSVDAVCQEDIDYYNENYEGGIEAIIKHNNDLLKELGLERATSKENGGLVMKDIRIDGVNRQIISIQTHPENLQIIDDRSQDVMRQLVEQPVVLPENNCKIIADNTNKMLANVVLGDELGEKKYIKMMKEPDNLFKKWLQNEKNATRSKSEGAEKRRKFIGAVLARRLSSQEETVKCRKGRKREEKGGKFRSSSCPTTNLLRRNSEVPKREEKGGKFRSSSCRRPSFF